MAKELKEIFEMPIGTIGQLKEQMKELKEQLQNLKVGTDEYNAANRLLIDDQKRLHAAMRTVKEDSEVGGKSFNQLSIQLAHLKEQWKATGDEAERAKIGAKVKEIKDAMNSMNESIGNYQHNVGNYTGSIIDAFKQMGISFGGTSVKFASMAGILTGGLSKLGGAFKSLWATMAANPIGVVLAALGALVGAFSALRKAIRDNEEAEERLHKAMSAFRPIADNFRNWLDQVAQGFVAFTENLAEAWNWLRKVYAAYTDWMGITEGREEKVKAQIQLYGALADAENKIDDLRRANKVKNSEQEAEISNLRMEAFETEKVSEKVEMLTKAKKLQMEVNARNIAEAKAELNILETQASLTANSAAMNDKLAEARAKVTRAEKAGSDAIKGLDREIRRATKSTQGLTQAVKEETDALLENDEVLKAINQAEADAEEEKWQAYEERYNKAQELRQQEADARKSDLDVAFEEEELRYQEQKELLEEFHFSTEDLEANHLERLEEIRKEAAEREAEMFEKANKDEQADDEKTEKKFENLMKAREAATKNMAKGTSTILKNLSAAMGENTKLGKGFAIAAATIDTIAAAVTGFRAGMNQWADAGPLAFMAPIQAALNAAMALTAGFAEVQKIRNVDTSGNSQGGGSTAMAVAIPNIEGLSTPMDYTRQVVTETEQEEMNRNNRVYILESDIQESGNRVRVREEETTF